jgi:hypothetical protein
MSEPSLDGRAFRDPRGTSVLECREQAGIVWARLAAPPGDAVAPVALALGTRDGDVIDLRCCHVDEAGSTRHTTIRADVVLLADGRLRLEGAERFDEIVRP